MDLIHGTWEVLFNLYLLAIGKSITFIGLRLAIQGAAGALMALAGGVRNPQLVWRLVLVSGLVSLGAGFGVRLMNVFLHDHVRAGHGEIGVTFAIGQLVLAAGALGVPFVVERFGKVGTVVLTRGLSVPFILMFAFSPEGAGGAGPRGRRAGRLVQTRRSSRTGRVHPFVV